MDSERCTKTTLLQMLDTQHCMSQLITWWMAGLRIARGGHSHRCNT